MMIDQLTNIYGISIFLYLFAAAGSVILYKNHKVCNIFANMVCVVAGVFGCLAALLHIVHNQATVNLVKLNSSFSFMLLDITIDKLSAFFVLALSVLVICVSIYSIGYIKHYYNSRNVGLFNLLYSLFILSMFLVVTAGNVVYFFIVWEIMSVLSYFLVVFESEISENSKAGTLYIIMTHIGAAFLMIAFLLMYSYTGSFDCFGSSAMIPSVVKNIIFILLLIGFGTKAGIIPLHIWLPRAHPAASSNVSALMSGIMIKTAVYGLIRFVLVYLGVDDLWWGVLILILGMISAVLGVAYALMESNIKRLLALSSIENIGIILIGLGISFIGFAEGNQLIGSIALIASLIHTFNHALFKGGLFLGAGAIQYATHTKDIEALGGLIKKMPRTSVMMLCFCLSICAIVPFNGFISEWLTYQSLFMNIYIGTTLVNILSILAIASLALAGALAAVCFVKLFGIAFLGLPRSKAAEDAREVPVSMQMGMMILAVLCCVIGIFPMAVIDILNNVVFDITQFSVTQQLGGGMFIAYYPMKLAGGQISPLIILALLVTIIIISLILCRLIGGKAKKRSYNTWDCGFKELNSRMQYTATGFSKPIRIVFRALYHPKRELKIDKGTSPYFPKYMEYKVTTESIFEKYLYNPLILSFNNFSLKAKNIIQTGSTHLYLLYILLVVLALLLYNRFV